MFSHDVCGESTSTEERDRALHYYEALYEVASALSSSLDSQVVLGRIVEGAAKASGSKACSILLLSPDRKTLLHEAAFGLSDWYMRKGPVRVDMSMADCLRGIPVAVFDAHVDPRVQYREQAKKEGIASMLCVPVKLRQEIMGVMRLYTSEPCRFSDADIYFLTAVANLGAIALDNARLYEATKNADALRKRMLAIVSHDLREPLVTTYSSLKAIIDGFAGEVSTDAAGMLKRVAGRLEGLLELHSAIMDARGFDAAQVMKQKEMVSLRELVRQALETVQASALQKTIALSAELPEADLRIPASATHLLRVLVNLLSNAVKFTPAKGQIAVRVQDAGDYVQVDVIDNGCGIAAQDLPHVFEDFYRGGVAPAKGLGLGLSIARRIVEAHKGSIWAESPYGPAEFGPGTRVSFLLTKAGP